MKPSAGRAALLLFVCAAVLRIGWIAYANGDWLGKFTTSAAADAPSLSYDDERVYWSMARNLVHDGEMISFEGRYAARMPLYPLLLAPFATLGENGIILAKCAQALFSALGVIWVYWFARAVGGPRAGLIAGAAAAVDPFAIFFSSLLLTEAPFATILVALTFAFWQIMRHESESRPATWLAAFLATAAIFMRPSATGFVVVLWLALLIRPRPAARRAVALGVVVLIAALIPWGARNWSVIGSTALLSSNGGVTLYDSLGPQARGDSNQSFLQDMPELSDLGECAADAELRHRAWQSLADNPQRAIELAGVKFRRTWSLTPNVAEHRAGATAVASATYTGVLLLVAPFGLWRARKIRSFGVSILLPVVYFTLLHMVYVGSVRYRVPLMPLLAVAAGVAGMAKDENSIKCAVAAK